jgi:DNA repair protein SbcC/Rad50
MFKWLFRPNWQHRDPAVRLAALQSGTPDTEVLLHLLADEVAEVRHAAIRLERDLDRLNSLLQHQDVATRQLTAVRLAELLASSDCECASWLDRCCAPPLVAEKLLMSGGVVQRRVALTHLADPQLADVAVNDDSGEVRLAAVEKISSTDWLDGVARRARQRDKRVSRRAQERLQALRAAASLPQRLNELVLAMESLAIQGLDELAAYQLQQQWQALGGTDSPLDPRFMAAVAAFGVANQRWRAQQQLQQRQRQIIDEREALLAGLGALDPNLAATTMADLTSQWSTLAEEGEYLATFADRYREQEQRWQGFLQDWREQQNHLNELHAILSQLEMKEVSAEAIDALARRWQQQVAMKAADSALQARYSHLLATARQRLSSRLAEQQAQCEELKHSLAALEEAIGEGKLHPAMKSADRVRELLQQLPANDRQSEQIRRRFQQLQPQLAEWRDWNRFGVEQTRHELITEMARLAATPMGGDARAKAVKALQSHWFELDRKLGKAPDTLWQQFQQQGQLAWADAAAHFASRRAEIEHHIAQRSDFVSQLEAEVAAIDLEGGDWPALDLWLQERKVAWRALGWVPADVWQQLGRRMNEVLAPVSQALEEQRQRQRMQREALIQQVERLKDESDLQRALSETRAAQAAWPTQAGEQQRREQALWRRFRAACDVIYQRSREERQQRQQLEQANYQRLSEYSTQLEALVARVAAGEANRSEAGPLLLAWDEVASNLTTREAQALKKRRDRALKGLAAAEVKAKAEAERQQRALWQRAAELCQQRETMLSLPSGESTSIIEQWQQIVPELAEPIATPLRLRWQQISAAEADLHGQDHWLELQQQAAVARQQLIIELEVLSGVDSPDEDREQRMVWQVAQLPMAMRGWNDEERQRAIIDRLRQWYGLFAAPAAIQQRFDARLARVLAACYGE